MKSIILAFTICATCSTSVIGQYESGKSIPDPNNQVVTDFNDWSYKLSTTITDSEIKDHIYTLASDEMEGRETGEKGNDKAAVYISQYFESLRLPKIGEDNSYYQPVAFTFSSWDKLSFQVGKKSYDHLRDFVSFPQYSSETKFKKDNVVFAGFGISTSNYDDYGGEEVTDKIVLIYEGEPITKSGTSLITGDDTRSEWSDDWKLKSKLAREKGAKLVLIISNNIQKLAQDNRRALVNRVTELGDQTSRSDYANTIFVSTNVAKDILGDMTNQVIEHRDAIISKSTLPSTLSIPTNISGFMNPKKQVLLGNNIMGFVEGTDKKEEVIVVSAHYDHVGTKGNEVYNGADDNASGTTVVLEIVEALQTAKLMKQGPRRSVLCLLVTGEEKGLLGSRYYSENPQFPIDNTIANINIDMQGRWGEEYQGTSQPYNYVIGSDRLSQDLHDINEEVNKKYSNILLDYKYNDVDDPNQFYYRSDHYNFAKFGIPAIFFFNGVHEDYHRLTDEVEKIDTDLMEKRGRQIFHLVWDLANRDERIRLKEQSKS